MRRARLLGAVLAASLAVNAAAAAYLLHRRATRPQVTDHRAERLELFGALAGTRPRIVMFGDSLTERGAWSDRHLAVSEEGAATTTRGAGVDTLPE